MNFKRNCLVITGIIMLILAVPAAAQDIQEVNETVTEADQEIAAYVNSEEISMQELEQFAGVRNILMQILQTNQEFGSVMLQTEAGQQVVDEFQKLKLEQLITNKLMVQEAKSRKLKVSDEEMNKIFDQQIQALKEQNQLSEEQLEAAIQKQGFESMKEYKELFFENNMNGFLINKLREEVVNKVKVSEEEVKDYYQNNKKQFESEAQKKVSHILFDDQAKAEKVLAEIKAGADFAEMAKKHSTGPTADKGGNLGYVSANERGLDQTFRDAAMKLEVGEITNEPVKTQFGFHLIKVTDYREAGVRDFEEVKAQIESNLKNKKKSQAFQDFVENLREKAEIDIKL